MVCQNCTASCHNQTRNLLAFTASRHNQTEYLLVFGEGFVKTLRGRGRDKKRRNELCAHRSCVLAPSDLTSLVADSLGCSPEIRFGWSTVTEGGRTERVGWGWRVHGLSRAIFLLFFLHGTYCARAGL